MYYIWFLVFALQEQTIDKEQITLIGYVIFVVLLLAVMVILFFVTFQKRKNKILQDKFKQEREFNEEISRTQTEIQEQTLKHVGWELHDNVGQLLAYANMQLKMVSSKAPEDLKSKLEDASNSVKESLKEVRSLSKSLNSEVVLNMGFEDSISNELNRIKRMKFETAELHIEGNKKELDDKKHQVILFRILQEFFSNSVKYSEAESINVILDYQETQLVIIAKDNGIGFDMNTSEQGSGLINMKSRAELINATFDLIAQPNKGVTLEIKYPY